MNRWRPSREREDTINSVTFGLSVSLLLNLLNCSRPCSIYTRWGPFFSCPKAASNHPFSKRKPNGRPTFITLLKLRWQRTPRKDRQLFDFCSILFSKVSIFKNKSCRARNEIIVNCFKLGHHLTRRLALELLQQVKNPHTPQRSDSMSEADEDLSIGAAPQRIASRRTKSEVFSKFLRKDQIFGTRSSVYDWSC